MNDNSNDIIRAPWTVPQVIALNRWQRDSRVHPFTCANDQCRRKDDEAALLATGRGWQCIYCDYTQDWAHAFMLKPRPPQSEIPLAVPLGKRDAALLEMLAKEHGLTASELAEYIIVESYRQALRSGLIKAEDLEGRVREMDEGEQGR